MLIGYARVSTADQKPAHQTDALRRAGVADPDIHLDVASGAKALRPKLELVLKIARAGDTIVVTRLDRLGRSMLHLVNLGADLRERGIGLKCSNRASTPTPPKDARCSACCRFSPSSSANSSSPTPETGSLPRAHAAGSVAAAPN